MPFDILRANSAGGHLVDYDVNVTTIWVLVTLLFIAVADAQHPRSADAFVDSIGVNTHLGYTDTIYREYTNIIKPRLLELGVRHIRDGTWSSDVAAKYQDLHAHGLRVLLISNPRRAVDQAKTLGRALWAIEGVNEPDKGDGWEAKLRAEQEALYHAVKGDPATAQVPVVVSSLANIRNSPGKLGDLTPFLDFGNIHPYAAGQMPTRHWGWGMSGDAALAEAKKVSTTKAIIATECGYHNKVDNKNHPGATEAAAAKYMPRLLLHYFSRGLVRNYIYEFADEKPDPEFKDMEQHFGLIRRDGSPKPVFLTLKNLIAILKDPGPAFAEKSFELAVPGETKKIQQMLLQKRDGRFYLAVWQEVPSYDSARRSDIAVKPQTITLQLNEQVRGASLYVPSRSTASTPLKITASRLTLDVPDEVILVEFTP